MRLHGLVFKPNDKCHFICICYYTGSQPTALLALMAVPKIFSYKPRVTAKSFFFHIFRTEWSLTRKLPSVYVDD
jgi:hypothetical protein